MNFSNNPKLQGNPTPKNHIITTNKKLTFENLKSIIKSI